MKNIALWVMAIVVVIAVVAYGLISVFDNEAVRSVKGFGPEFAKAARERDGTRLLSLASSLKSTEERQAVMNAACRLGDPNGCLIDQIEKFIAAPPKSEAARVALASIDSFCKAGNPTACSASVSIRLWSRDDLDSNVVAETAAYQKRALDAYSVECGKGVISACDAMKPLGPNASDAVKEANANAAEPTAEPPPPVPAIAYAPLKNMPPLEIESGEDSNGRFVSVRNARFEGLDGRRRRPLWIACRVGERITFTQESDDFGTDYGPPSTMPVQVITSNFDRYVDVFQLDDWRSGNLVTGDDRARMLRFLGPSARCDGADVCLPMERLKSARILRSGYYDRIARIGFGSNQINVYEDSITLDLKRPEIRDIIARCGF